MQSLKKSLIVAGTGRNIGKTTFVCNIINRNKDKNIIAIKISPHFHELDNDLSIIENINNKYVIIEETNKNKPKDSAKMLLAGADRAFYIQCNDNYIEQAINKILRIIPKNSNLIIESGGIRKYFKPDLFIMIKSFNNTDKLNTKELLQLADVSVVFKNNSHDFDYKNIILAKEGWSLTSNTNLY